MSTRAAAWLSRLLFALTAGLLLAMTLLSVGREPVFDTLLYGLLSISLATVGALVASRHPRNPIGWMFCGLGLFGAFAESAEGGATSRPTRACRPERWASGSSSGAGSLTSRCGLSFSCCSPMAAFRLGAGGSCCGSRQPGAPWRFRARL